MIYDFVVVGGGIVGLSTALSIHKRRPDASILVLEKEAGLSQHQTAHNSGVIHAGIYYAPGSLKADLCRKGEIATKEFCGEHDIAFKVPGKLVVATNPTELQRLGALQENAAANGIIVSRIGADELGALEPNIAGQGALLVENSGIVDYRQIARKIGEILVQAGHDIIHNVTVDRIEEQLGQVLVVAGERHWLCRHAIACAGLQADRLARNSGLKIDFRIVPFRGEYFVLRPEKSDLVQRMIYPVPDPSLPFLGIHLTPMIDGTLTVGPNAVLGFSREGYDRFSFSAGDVLNYLAFPGFWRSMMSNVKVGIAEAKDSLIKSSYLEKCRKYCPSLELADLQTYRSGIRAQAISRRGDMIHDFAFLQTDRVLHVCNAPSPAATSALPIGNMIFDRLESRK